MSKIWYLTSTCMQSNRIRHSYVAVYMWGPSANGPGAGNSYTWCYVLVLHIPSANGYVAPGSNASNASSQCTQRNHSKVSFSCTSLVSRASVQWQVENTAVWSIYKQCNMDRIVYGGVTVSVHEEKEYTAYSPLMHWHHLQLCEARRPITKVWKMCVHKKAI